jgi:DNA-binding transcriptional ArsR family regulator
MLLRQLSCGPHSCSYACGAWRPVRTWQKPGAPAEAALSGCLRNCASNDIVDAVLGEITVSSEIDRQRYAAIGRALADPKRLCVLESLASGELSVGDLSATVGCQIPNMSQHLAVLRSAGLVAARREGSTVFYRLTDSRVLEAYRLIQTLAR